MDSGVIYHIYDFSKDVKVQKCVLEKCGFEDEDTLLYIEGKGYSLEQVKELVKNGKLKGMIPKENRKEIIYEKIEGIIKSKPVVLFMKGTPTAPECGFSKRVVLILQQFKVDFTHFNVFDDFVLKE